MTPICVFTLLAVVFAVIGFRREASPFANAGASRGPWALRVFEWEIEFLTESVGRLVTLSLPRPTRKISRLIRLAGLTHCLSPSGLVGLQAFLALALSVAFGASALILAPGLALAAGLICVTVGAVLPLLWLHRLAARRRKAMLKELPEWLDLLRVAAEAGQTIDAALRLLVPQGAKGPLRDEFALMLDDQGIGSRDEALAAMAERVQLDAFDAFVAASAFSQNRGARMGRALRAQAAAIRKRLICEAELRAARVPVLMMLPVAVFFLPAVFIVILVPFLVRLPV